MNHQLPPNRKELMQLHYSTRYLMQCPARRDPDRGQNTAPQSIRAKDPDGQSHTAGRHSSVDELRHHMQRQLAHAPIEAAL